MRVWIRATSQANGLRGLVNEKRGVSLPLTPRRPCLQRFLECNSVLEEPATPSTRVFLLLPRLVTVIDNRVITKWGTQTAIETLVKLRDVTCTRDPEYPVGIFENTMLCHSRDTLRVVTRDRTNYDRRKFSMQRNDRKKKQTKTLETNMRE